MNKHSEVEKEETFEERLLRIRRQRILGAAIEVFAERGFHGATIRDVAKAAGVADGTIYNYFENKTALLLGVLDPLSEREKRDADFAPTQPTDLRQFLRERIVQRWAVFDAENLKALRVTLSEALVNPEFRALYLERVIAPTFTLAEPAFERLMAQGALRPLNAPLTLRAMTAAFLGFVMLRLLGDLQTQNQWDDIPELLTTLLLDGLLPTDDILSSEGDSDGPV